MKPSLATATEIASQQSIAIVGASRNSRKFANAMGRELKERGCQVFYVHPQAERIEGEPCYRSLSDLPAPVGTVLVVLRPERVMNVLEDVVKAGIKRVWLQRGAGTDEALRFCDEHGIAAVGGYCMLMFSQPSYAPHTIHRCMVKLLGRLPK